MEGGGGSYSVAIGVAGAEAVVAIFPKEAGLYY
jgi:hypothetical protein